MHLPACLASSAVLAALVLSGCAKPALTRATGGSGVIGVGGSGGSGVIVTSGGIGTGGSGGTSTGTSGGTGTGTSGGTGTGTSGGMGGSGGTGGSGGSGSSGGSGAVIAPPGSPKIAGVGSGSPGSAATAIQPVEGLVNGGQDRAIVGARLYVLEANNTTPANPSVSLLTSATGNPADSIGNYVLTGEYGGFSITGDYSCTPSRQVYLYARGGNSGGGGANAAIGLMTMLGACPASGTFASAAPFVFVNAVSTVAAAYTMAGFATDATHVSNTGALSPVTGIVRAGDLASLTTGFANTTLPADRSRKVPRSKIHTLANILSACINASGPSSDGCTTLFANARNGGDTGTMPTDTATAVLNIAHHPQVNVSALYALQLNSGAPFAPNLGSAPDDFTIRLDAEGLDSNAQNVLRNSISASLSLSDKSAPK